MTGNRTPHSRPGKHETPRTLKTEGRGVIVPELPTRRRRALNVLDKLAATERDQHTGPILANEVHTHAGPEMLAASITPGHAAHVAPTSTDHDTVA